MKYIAVLDKTSKLVKGLQRSNALPVPRAHEEFVELLETEYATISSGGLTFNQNGELKWQKNNVTGVIESRTDTRPKGVISIVDTEIDVGSNLQATIEIQNYLGVPLSFTGTKKIGVVQRGYPLRVFKVSFVNGTKSINRTMNRSGDYEFVSIGNYILEGDLEFSVVEQF